MQISRELLERVAENACLKLTEEEIQLFLPQLEEILKAFETLKEIKSSEEESIQPVSLKENNREDTPIKHYTVEEILSNSNYTKNNYIKSPRTLD